MASKTAAEKSKHSTETETETTIVEAIEIATEQALASQTVEASGTFATEISENPTVYVTKVSVKLGSSTIRTCIRNFLNQGIKTCRSRSIRICQRSSIRNC